MQIKVGSFTGDGIDNRGITGIGFLPNFVLIKREGFGGNHAVIRTSAMAGDASKPINSATGLTANMIQTLDADGFTLGTDASVNTSGQTYDYLAIQSHANDFVVGSYTGNATDNRSITGIGFLPTVVIVMGDSTVEAVYRAGGNSGDDSNDFASGGGADLIQALEADGFQVGTGGQVNTNAITYYYAAWKDTAGFSKTASYAGDGIDNRSITGVGFQPNFVHVGRTSGFHDPPYLRAAHVGDLASTYSTSGAVANVIQAHETDGFQIGTHASANANGPTYGYFALKDGDSQAGAGADVRKHIISAYMRMN